MNHHARVTPVLRYLLTGLLFAIGLQSAPSWGACTAANPNANVAEATPSADFPTNNPNSPSVTHAKTGLTWKRCSEGQVLSGGTCTGTATAMTWSAALASAATANAGYFDGYNDWRLANQKELESIVETCGFNPAINQTVFPATPASLFWSASTYVPSPTFAWLVNFTIGYDSANLKSNVNYVRLVRGGQSFDSFDVQKASQTITLGVIKTDVAKLHA